MNVAFTFKNIDASAPIKEYASSRFSKLEKLVLNPDNTDIQLNFSVDKFRHICEVILNSDSAHISAYEESDDMYKTIDKVLEKVEAQVRRIREKIISRRRKDVSPARMDVINFEEESNSPKTPRIVESDQYTPKPMSVEEAAMQLEAFNHEFLVFRNAETEAINVIYHRNDGDYGLIDPGN